MLVGYPIEATAENWFHECLMKMLQTIHESIRNGQEPSAWPEIIPEESRAIIGRHPGLKSRLERYVEVATNLNHDELEQVSIALTNQNDIVRLLSCACDCESIDLLPELIRAPVKDLFGFGFDLLADLGVRDRQYVVIFQKARYKNVCPFCGIEYFSSPTAPRNSLDHYLAKSKYPFAATNLMNLVPMGTDCNSKYKLAQDILYKADGVTRRKSFFPYDEISVQISLEKSSPFSGDQGIFSPPEWEIDLLPHSEEVETWDEVFHIRERYRREILEVDFKPWLWDFMSWCKSAVVRADFMEDVVVALQRYINYLRSGGIKDRAFLKAAVFQMLYRECQQNNQRVIGIFGALVFGVDFFVNREPFQ